MKSKKKFPTPWRVVHRELKDDFMVTFYRNRLDVRSSFLVMRRRLTGYGSNDFESRTEIEPGPSMEDVCTRLELSDKKQVILDMMRDGMELYLKLINRYLWVTSKDRKREKKKSRYLQHEIMCYREKLRHTKYQIQEQNKILLKKKKQEEKNLFRELRVLKAQTKGQEVVLRRLQEAEKRIRARRAARIKAAREAELRRRERARSETRFARRVDL